MRTVRIPRTVEIMDVETMEAETIKVETMDVDTPGVRSIASAVRPEPYAYHHSTC